SNLITIEEVTAGTLAKPDKGTVALRAPAPAPTAPPDSVTPDTFVGDVGDRTGFGGLEVVEDITMIPVPDLMGLYQRDLIDLAGVWARTDGTRGVHKAPANEVIRGVVELQTQLTRAEQEKLNPLGVNCLRSFSGRGIRVWGARTLSSDAEWRYLNVRRLFNYL